MPNRHQWIQAASNAALSHKKKNNTNFWLQRKKSLKKATMPHRFAKKHEENGSSSLLEQATYYALLFAKIVLPKRRRWCLLYPIILLAGSIIGHSITAKDYPKKSVINIIFTRAGWAMAALPMLVLIYRMERNVNQVIHFSFVSLHSILLIIIDWIITFVSARPIQIKSIFFLAPFCLLSFYFHVYWSITSFYEYILAAKFRLSHPGTVHGIIIATKKQYVYKIATFIRLLLATTYWFLLTQSWFGLHSSLIDSIDAQ